MLEGGNDGNERNGDDYTSGVLQPSNSAPGNKKDSGGIVVARGTGDGLILRLDGRVEREILLSTLLEYVESRRSFFSGQEVTLEWIEARPEEGVVSELSQALNGRFQLLVKASRMFERAKPAARKAEPQSDELSSSALRIKPSPVTPKLGERAPILPGPTANQPPFTDRFSSGSSAVNSFETAPQGRGFLQGSTSLFDGVAALGGGLAGQVSATQDKRSLSSEALLWDEADTRIIRETLRGGQKIESEHSVVIVGDVNSGAEIVAGGDIFVLGRLRGVAHAGAYDESGGGRKIFSLQMQPTQLRIGSIISQGSEEGGRMPEIAKIEGNMIVVEPYGAASQVRRLGR